MTTLTPVPVWLEKWQTQQLATEPRRVPKTELLTTLKKSPKSVTVVDIRNELEKGFITQAVHIPATIINGPEDVNEKLVTPVLEKYPETSKIVLYCNLSAKRTTYVGGWAKDYVDNHGPKNVDVEILHGGIVDWLTGDELFLSETTIPSS